MRDLKVIVPTDGSDWDMDIDVIDGYPEYVTHPRNTQDQRAALAAYTVKGTIPGMPDVGVSWSDLYEQGVTVLDLDNQIKQAIQKNAGVPGTPVQSYIPVYEIKDEKIRLGIFQTQ